jgi:hypothetical protein
MRRGRDWVTESKSRRRKARRRQTPGHAKPKTLAVKSPWLGLWGELAVRLGFQHWAACMPIPVYHITHLNNLASIIECRGLWCDAERVRQGLGHESIAHGHIKARRARRRVRTDAGGTLADYVPFYFAPRSPMLFTINQGNVDPALRGQQGLILHLVSTVERLVSAGPPWCFTDRHADLDYARFLTDPAALSTAIRWDVMGDDFWGRSQEQRELRQAEFLVRSHVAWEDILEIGVMNEATSVAVVELLEQHDDSTPVVVHRGWYY